MTLCLMRALQLLLRRASPPGRTCGARLPDLQGQRAQARTFAVHLCDSRTNEVCFVRLSHNHLRLRIYTRHFLVLPAVHLPRWPMLAGMHDCVSSVTVHVSLPRVRGILDARDIRPHRGHCERMLYQYHAVLAQAQLACTDCGPPISVSLTHESFLSVCMTRGQHTPSVSEDLPFHDTQAV